MRTRGTKSSANTRADLGHEDATREDPSWLPAVLGARSAASVAALQRAAGNRATSALLGPPIRRVFTDQNNLDTHYQKHVVDQGEYGGMTKPQYNALSTDLWKRKSGLQSKQAANGRTYVFDSATGDFAVFTTGGKAVTVFRPKSGQKYYDKQT
jgi:hypothetical protein